MEALDICSTCGKKFGLFDSKFVCEDCKKPFCSLCSKEFKQDLNTWDKSCKKCTNKFEVSLYGSSKTRKNRQKFFDIIEQRGPIESNNFIFTYKEGAVFVDELVNEKKFLIFPWVSERFLGALDNYSINIPESYDKKLEKAIQQILKEYGHEPPIDAGKNRISRAKRIFR